MFEIFFKGSSSFTLLQRARSPCRTQPKGRRDTRHRRGEISLHRTPRLQKHRARASSERKVERVCSESFFCFSHLLTGRSGRISRKKRTQPPCKMSAIMATLAVPAATPPPASAAANEGGRAKRKISKPERFQSPPPAKRFVFAQFPIPLPTAFFFPPFIVVFFNLAPRTSVFAR